MFLPSAGVLPRLLPLLALLWGIAVAPARAQTPFFGPTVSVGTTQGGESYVGAMATDAQGNVYVTGSFVGNLRFGTQQLTSHLNYYDIFVAKYDAAGNYRWAVDAGGSAPDYAVGLALDASGNVYITGHYSSPANFGTITLPDPGGNTSDIFVAKLDPGGNWLWAAHGGGPNNEYGAAVAIDATGTVTVVGSFTSTTATFGATPLANAASSPLANTSDIFVGRLNSAGSWLGATAAGGIGMDVANGLALDAAGNAYVGGSFAGPTIGFGSSTLVNADPSATSSDAFVAKITPTGSWQWAARAGGSSYDRVQGIALDASGLPYVTGGFGGTAAFGATTLVNQGPLPSLDIFVAALDANGAWRWATQAGGSDAEAGSGIAVNNTGEIVITGEFLSRTAQFGSTGLANTSAAGKSDAFVARLTTTGAWQWALGTTGTEDESGHAVAFAPDGGACVIGTYWGQATFGNTSLTGNQLFSNIFLTKIYDNMQLRVTTIAPSSGAPGQTVTLTGSGFVGVTAVIFNGTPASSFAVQSALRLTAVVPANATAGPVSVRTGAGTSSSVTAFQPAVLAIADAQENARLLVWPNPVSAAELLRLELPKALSATSTTQIELRNVLGQVARTMQFSGRTTSLSMRGLAPGVYQLALFPAGQPAQWRRIVVTE